MDINDKEKECLQDIITWAVAEGYSLSLEEKQLIDKLEIPEDRQEYIKGIAGADCFEPKQ